MNLKAPWAHLTTSREYGIGPEGLGRHTYSLSFNLSGVNYDRLRHILKDNYNLDKITYLWSEFSPVFSAGRSHISIDTILNVSFNVALE